MRDDAFYWQPASLQVPGWMRANKQTGIWCLHCSVTLAHTSF